MPAIQFGGLSSNLDTAGIIRALLDAERMPLLRLQRQELAISARRTAYESLGTSLRDLLAKAEAFTLTSAGSARTATYAAPATLAAVASTAAVPGTYQVTVDRLASATRATSTAAVGTAVTATTAANPMATLPLAGAATAGQVGVVVDGTVVTATIGDPATTSLQSALDAIASAVQAHIVLTDAGATVSASVVNNTVRLSISGASSGHAIHVGVGSDTSNLAILTGLTGLSATDFGTGTTALDGTARLGVVQATVALDAAGLSGLASTTTGLITIDGVAIAYDTTTDGLSDVLGRINGSAAGVVASIDRTNDRIVLSRKVTGPVALDIRDTSGTLAAALDLGPGTTTAQAVGQTSQVKVEGRTIVGDSNSVSGAIEGVTLNLLSTSATAATLTVGVDATAIESALGAFVSSFNALTDRIAALTTHPQGATSAALEGNATISGLALALRTIVTGAAGNGAFRSLADVGVSSGTIGAVVGTTNRLSLEPAKLHAALERDPVGVATLLNGANGAIQPLVARLNGLVGETGPVQAGTTGVDAELKLVQTAMRRVEDRLTERQKTLEAQFARFEATLSRLRLVQGSLAAQVTWLDQSANQS